MRDRHVDIPASAVLLGVYLCLAVVHGYYFVRVSKRTFIPQVLTMAFCYARVVTLSLRIAWTAHVTNKNLAIAANVFTNAGILLLYIVNLIFLHRFILQLFPQIPTSRRYPFNLIVHIYMFTIIPLVILVIVPGVQLFLSSNSVQISTDRDILRFAQCYLTVMACLQVIGVIAAWTIYFAHSKMASGIPAGEVSIRAAIILATASLFVWIQTVKILQMFYTPNPQTAEHPPWFFRRPILYSGFFLPELLVVIIYAVSSIRLRFLMPNRENKQLSPVSYGDTVVTDVGVKAGA